MIATDQMYDLAFRFKKSELWQRLHDTQLFAVAHSDGTIGYCCVMGRLGEHLALAVYPGSEGLDSYRNVFMTQASFDTPQAQETSLSQHCVMCSFARKDELHPHDRKEVQAYCKTRQLVLRGKNAFPLLECYRPHYFPWHLDDPVQQLYLMEGLEAALEVFARLQDEAPEDLGFTEEGATDGLAIPLLTKTKTGYLWSSTQLPAYTLVCHPNASLENDLLAAKLKKTPQNSGDWVCDIFRHREPMVDESIGMSLKQEPSSAPFYPYLMLLLDNTSGMILTLSVSSKPDDYAQDFLRAFTDAILKHGKPTRLLVQNARTLSFFLGLSQQLGIKLASGDHLPILEEAKADFLAQFDRDDPEGGGLSEIMDALQNDEVLSSMPDELLERLLEAASCGAFPPEICQRLLGESNRRGLSSKGAPRKR